MTRSSPLYLLLVAATLGLSALGCESGGVGDPCTPEDEYQQKFNGYGVTEVNIESKSFQCETRVCIVNHFEGRVSCPYGQTEADIAMEGPTSAKRCRVPGTSGDHCIDDLTTGNTVPCGGAAINIDEVTVPVTSQRLARNGQDTVYCSCRCKGPDTTARYCECPSGYSCTELVKELGLQGASQLAGSYCVKDGTVYKPEAAGTVAPETCADARDAGRSQSRDGKYNIADVCGPNGSNP